jgi:hypothetical protein
MSADPFLFLVICPKCGSKFRASYPLNELRGKLTNGNDLDLHCFQCDATWQASEEMRAALSRDLGASKEDSE